MSMTELSTPPSPAALEPLLTVSGLRVERARHGGAGKGTIVSSVDLTLAPGETIGIVGESGSGKSLTAKAVNGLLPPGLTAHGEVRYGDRNLLALRERDWRAVRGREIGMVLQDPFTMLNPIMRVGRIIEESMILEPENREPAGRRARRATRRTEVARRLTEVGITDETVADRYPFQLSGGMRQRVAIAAALARNPRVLVADEPSTALDVATQREILALIKQIQRARGMALILITHDLRVAFAMCDRIYVLYAGSLVETGGVTELMAEPLHPYSHGLLMSEPPGDHRVRELLAIPGTVPSADDVTGSCPFAPRCAWAAPQCRAASPPLGEVASGRWSACVRLPEIRTEMAALRARAEQAVHPAPPPRRDDPVIVVRDIRKVFHTGDRDVTALDGASIEIGPGESVGLVGESGSGKSTLARLLVGLEHPTSGGITIDGITATSWDRLSGEERQRLRGTVQIVFQDPYSSLNPMRTIGSALGEAIATHEPGVRRLQPRVHELLESVGLDPAYARRKPVALSGGERQRVAIARALAARPRILICDEPVSALDVSVQAQILNLFTALRSDHGVGYVFITHDLSIVRQITDHLYVLHRGRVVESGPTDGVLADPREPYTIKLLDSMPRSDADWLEATP